MAHGDLAQWNRDRFLGYLQDSRGFSASETVDAALLLDKALARGDALLVYENHDLGHPEVGSPKIVSYGSNESYITEAQFPAPPPILPDTPRDINWRYALIARVT